MGGRVALAAQSARLPENARRERASPEGRSHPPARCWAVLGAVVLVAAALRFPSLSLQSYWQDEGFTIEVVRSSLGRLFHLVARTESTPPLYYLLAWGWRHPFGTSEWGLRSLSALAGVASVPVVFAAARHFAGTRAALIAAALVACNPMLVWYSQEARAYSLLVLMAAVGLLLFARARERPTAGRLAAWAAVGVLTLLTHYFGVFLVAAEGLLLWAPLAGRRRAIAVAVSAIAAVGMAILPLALQQAATGRATWIADQPLPARVEAVAGALLSANTLLITSGRAPTGPVGIGILAVVLGGTLVLARRLDARERPGAALAGALGGLALALPLVLSLVGVDYFLDRNLIAAWVVLATALAAVLGARRAGAAGLAVAAAACLAGVVVNQQVFTDARLRHSDWRGVAGALGSPLTGRAIVVRPGYAKLIMKAYGHRIVEFPRSGLPVREIALVGRARRSEVELPAAFRLVERRRLGNLAVVRYVAAWPVAVTPRQLGKGQTQLAYEPPWRVKRECFPACRS
jgi:mannosyltransferase